jgi:Zona pellucida-like domain
MICAFQVELKFDEKFYGIAYADFDRNSACQTHGKGDLSYRIELPLKGCGTRQEPQRVFTNNIVVRFHPGLEMDGDEIITIVCRYPPPITPIPAGLPAPM